jgi:hypothetical protein
MSYKKRVTSKIRSACGPLIKDHEKGLVFGSIGGKLERFEWLDFLEEISEKGCSRKYTKNRVARWRLMFWGNLAILRWFTKRIYLGELGIGIFGGFLRGSTWAYWGGGTLMCFCVRWGIYLVDWSWFCKPLMCYGMTCNPVTHVIIRLKVWVGGGFPKNTSWARGFLRTTVTGEGFSENNCHWRGVS